jgi:hypothetical protein
MRHTIAFINNSVPADLFSWSSNLGGEQESILKMNFMLGTMNGHEYFSAWEGDRGPRSNEIDQSYWMRAINWTTHGKVQLNKGSICFK